MNWKEQVPVHTWKPFWLLTIIVKLQLMLSNTKNKFTLILNFYPTAKTERGIISYHQMQCWVKNHSFITFCTSYYNCFSYDHFQFNSLPHHKQLTNALGRTVFKIIKEKIATLSQESYKKVMGSFFSWKWFGSPNRFK